MFPRADGVRLDTQKPREDDLAHSQKAAHPAHTIRAKCGADELGMVGADRKPSFRSDRLDGRFETCIRHYRRWPPSELN